ncbi:MAG: helix-turn-helix transcriptional regulator [Bacillota bacterium]
MTIELGRRIKALRRLKLVTQQELASKVNISVTMLSNIETGQKNPPPQLLENIAAFLKVPGEELFILSTVKILSKQDHSGLSV